MHFFRTREAEKNNIVKAENKQKQDDMHMKAIYFVSLALTLAAIVSFTEGTSTAGPTTTQAATTTGTTGAAITTTAGMTTPAPPPVTTSDSTPTARYQSFVVLATASIVTLSLSLLH
jgi:hypothetical protein